MKNIICLPVQGVEANDSGMLVVVNHSGPSSHGVRKEQVAAEKGSSNTGHSVSNG